MTHVYILTITDQADFGRVKHHSAWASYQSAETFARSMTATLVAKDTSGLGDTYDTDICQMEVNP